MMPSQSNPSSEIKLKEYRDLFKFLVIAFSAFAIVIFSSLHSDKFRSIIGLIDFKTIKLNNVAEVLTLLMLVALFFERALEVYVLTFRKYKDQELEIIANSIKATPEDKRDLTEYRRDTCRITVWAALLGGILVSIVGVRGLEPFANLPKDASGWQYFYFRILDIFLTGAVIAGGSQPIHQILQVFTTFTEAITTSNKANAASSQAATAEMHKAATEDVATAAQTATEQATAANVAAEQATAAAQTATEQATAAKAAAEQATAASGAVTQTTAQSTSETVSGEAAAASQPPVESSSSPTVRTP
jgi:hypothetical protein